MLKGLKGSFLDMKEILIEKKRPIVQVLPYFGEIVKKLIIASSSWEKSLNISPRLGVLFRIFCAGVLLDTIRYDNFVLGAFFWENPKTDL